MVDDLRSEDGLSGYNGHHHRPSRRSDSVRQVSDREVPLSHQEPDARVLSPALHAWLDGELPEAAARKASSGRDVELWKNINAEVDQRRHMRTPTYLEARIMDKLPQSAPRLNSPWWRREFVVTPVAAVGAAAALIVIAAGIAAGIVFFTR
jgi:anti-sigma factor RsiW